MPGKAQSFDADSVRQEWDQAAAAYVDAQSTGRDFYRLEVFGPAQAQLCGSVRGLRVLDIGCGAGYFAREMAARGATVAAIDISPEMISYAEKVETQRAHGIRYLVGDAAELRRHFAPESFDIVTSCLALQDMPDVVGVIRSVRELLIPGGRFVVSITHPCTDTPFRRWQKDDAGRKQCLCIDKYFQRGPLAYQWKDWAYEFTTTALHATLEDWLEWFTQARFTLRALKEPRPSEDAIARHPELDDCSRVPYFVLLDFERR